MSTATDLPSALAGELLPVDWMGLSHGLRIAISPLDEFDLPLERRGITTKLPTDPATYEKFAADVAESVRKTVLHIVKRGTP